MASYPRRMFLPILVLFLALQPRGLDRLSAQDVDFADHFRVYTQDGAPATLDDIVRAMAEADAVLVGEIHTDPGFSGARESSRSKGFGSICAILSEAI